MLSLNLLTFISIDPSGIESITSTDDILPEEEIESLNNSIRYSLYGI